MGTERHLLCIEDPFQLSHDLGRTVHRDGCQLLRREFRRAAAICTTSTDVPRELFQPVAVREVEKQLSGLRFSGPGRGGLGRGGGGGGGGGGGDGLGGQAGSGRTPLRGGQRSEPPAAQGLQ